ncbi:MAG TPA: M42 family metallopeptidase [Thermodesulfobacteriota bacterium]|nr:M42 family metallopeptidase [Thermodesulfobacteriota bacterium]
MRAQSYEFLRNLTEAPSPSGYEQPAQKIFREYIQETVDEVRTDVLGNTIGLIKGEGTGRPTLMLAGHCDEIGFMVKYIDDHGFAYFAAIGGVDEQLLPGKRVWIHSRKGRLTGVIGRKPIHLIESKDRDKVARIHTLFVDFGAKDRKEAEEAIRIGDPITFAVGIEKLMGDRVVSRGFDDKIGSFVVAEVLRSVAEKKERPRCDLYGVSTVQEEIGLRGATTSAYRIRPDIGVAIEVGHTSDYPDVDKKQLGEYKLGGGPIISRGANINPKVFDLFLEAATKENIPVQVVGAPRGTGTDANVIQLTRDGVATGLVAVPLRYMHTPGEVASLEDLESTCRLLTAFVYSLKEGMDFTPK